MTTVRIHRENLRASAQLLLAAGYLLWYSSRLGNMTPWGTKIWERMQDPQPGDIVIPLGEKLHNALVQKEAQEVGILIRIEKHYPKSDEARKTIPYKFWWRLDPSETQRVIIVQRIFDGELEIRPYAGGLLALPDDAIPLMSEHGFERTEILRGDIAERQGRARDAYNNHLEELRWLPEPYAGEAGA